VSGPDPITLRSLDGTTSATFLPGANLVCSELRYEGADWLDPVRALESVATGKDYGISLVHPWAGRLARFGYDAAGRSVTLASDAEPLKLDKQGLPIHGVRDSYLRWVVEQQEADRLTARMDWSDARLLELFPYPHELAVIAVIDSARLRIETVLRPTADVAVPVSFGYHAFLRIPSSARAGWTLGLGGRDRILVDGAQIPTGDTELIPRDVVLGDAGVNDDVGGLVPGDRLAFHDAHSTVTMVIEGGYSAAHVFAPAEWNLISLEPQVAPANALNSGDGLPVVEPGSTFRGSFAIELAR
jgi:galactose mutarotase-like enzyme